MFLRKPLFLLEPDDEPGGGDPAPEPKDEPKDEPKPQEGSDPDPEPDAEPFDAARALAKIKKANSEAKAQRDRAKAAEEKAEGLAPKAREAAEQRVARRLGLPDTAEVDEFLSRLKGETVDELAEDAERLLSLLAPKDKPPTKTKPTERLRGGGDPDTEPEVDNKKLADDILSGF